MEYIKTLTIILTLYAATAIDVGVRVLQTTIATPPVYIDKEGVGQY